MPKIEMNLSDYLRVIRKRKRIIILSFILVLASTFYYTQKLTPIYSTSCKVKIEQRKSVASILTELITWSPGDAMASQANLIKSYQTMEIVAIRLNMIKPVETNEEHRDPRRMAIIKGLQGAISTQQVGTTNIIAITAISNKPEKTAELANTVAMVYEQTHFENKKQEASNARQFIQEQLNSYLKELRENETELQRFRQDNRIGKTKF